MKRERGWKLSAALTAAALVLAPPAEADPGSPSYNLGKQTIQDAAQKNPLQDDNGLAGYCANLLNWILKTGKVQQVDSPTDFIAGCQDEGHALLGPH